MNIVGEMQVHGKPYAIIDNVGGFVHGVYARYLLTPMSCINKNLNNLVEIVKDDPSNTATEPEIPSDEPAAQLDDQGVQNTQASTDVPQ